MCAEGHRPICQDTGIVNVFLKIGMDVRWEGFTGSHRGRRQRRRAPGLPEPRQRAARLVLDDPIFARKNTKDNTPAVIHMTLVPGNTVDVTVAAKGGGSENKSKL
jgi:fumarate hydratase class I